MSTTNFPSAYRKFENLHPLYKHNKNKKLLYRFIYRYRLAKSFTEINAEGIGKTLKGYNSILKIFLTYTAYEQLHKSIEGLHIFQINHIKDHQIINRVLAERLRNNKKLINFIVEHTFETTLKQKLRQFEADKSDDIVRVAYAIRNIFAHGDMTATTAGTELKSQRDTLLKLANELLIFCDSTFSKSIEKLR